MSAWIVPMRLCNSGFAIDYARRDLWTRASPCGFNPSGELHNMPTPTELGRQLFTLNQEAIRQLPRRRGDGRDTERLPASASGSSLTAGATSRIVRMCRCYKAFAASPTNAAGGQRAGNRDVQAADGIEHSQPPASCAACPSFSGGLGLMEMVVHGSTGGRS